MGKVQKKKNAGVGVVFKRVRHKVGKKLPRAQNQTDTNFKSRSISMPEQSVGADKGGAAVTHRNLTLKVLRPAELQSDSTQHSTNSSSRQACQLLSMPNTCWPAGSPGAVRPLQRAGASGRGARHR